MADDPKPQRILFVCLGNICRSPMAQGVFEHAAAQAGLSTRFESDSAGTAGWHIGKQPDARAVAAAARRGIDLSHQRARQVTESDFAAFDHILAMDASNFGELLTFAGDGRGQKVAMFLESGDVPDPYYGGDGGFDEVLDLIEDGVAKLLGRLR